jgi:hypothetical protein
VLEKSGDPGKFRNPFETWTFLKRQQTSSIKMLMMKPWVQIGRVGFEILGGDVDRVVG